MALMTVNDEGSTDFRSNNRWSASKKLDVVLRLLRGEKLEEVSRELGVEAHRSPPGETSSSTPARRA